MTYITIFIESTCIVYSLLFKNMCVLVIEKGLRGCTLGCDISYGGMAVVWIFSLSSFCLVVFKFFIFVLQELHIDFVMKS